MKKSKFALELALSDGDWNIPRYIRSGLTWLAEGDPPPVPAPPNDAEVVA